MKQKKYDNDWPIVAICYDFDKTLSPKDMQAFDLIPLLGMQTSDFWKESNKFAKENGMDKMLSYMKLILEKAHNKGIPIKKSDFKKMGKTVNLFEGVESWFGRINKLGAENEVNVEHYIISAGLKEILEGTKIAKNFEAIYASSFAYNEYDAPIWTKQVVNYTTKTQYLFRINKNCLDLSDEDSVNEYKADYERRIPFRNFIYIGDSDTDIPAMRVVKREKGHSIGVYNPTEKNVKKVCELIQRERIDFFAPADYSEGSEIEEIVIGIIEKIRANHDFCVRSEDLEGLNAIQNDMAKDINYYLGFVEMMEGEIKADKDFDCTENKAWVKRFTKHQKQGFKKEHARYYNDIEKFLCIFDDCEKRLLIKIEERLHADKKTQRITLKNEPNKK